MKKCLRCLCPSSTGPGNQKGFLTNIDARWHSPTHPGRTKINKEINKEIHKEINEGKGFF